MKSLLCEGKNKCDSTGFSTNLHNVFVVEGKVFKYQLILVIHLAIHFTGSLLSLLVESFTPCQQAIVLQDSTPVFLTSPGFTEGKPYPPNTLCSWDVTTYNAVWRTRSASLWYGASFGSFSINPHKRSFYR